MEKIERDKIYIGKLVEPIEISVEKYEQNYQRLSGEEKNKIYKYDRNICYKEIIRPILFRIDKKRLAEDLIYDVNMHYPILELNSHSQFTSMYIVENIIKMDQLLKYLNYKEFLSHHEIKKIYRQLVLSSKWLEQNRSLFGKVEIMPDVYIDSNKGEFSPDMYDKLMKIHLISNKKPKERELTKTLE